MRSSNVLHSGHRLHPALLLLLPLLAACVTTQDRFTRAFEAEQEGDLYGAARAYADVLRRDPDFRDARRRFEATARLAADSLYARAEWDGQRARYEAAVERLDRFAALRRLAGEFGVLIPQPDAFGERYAAVNEGAARALLDRADALAADRRFDDADEVYGRAYRYEMPGALRDALDHRRVRALVDAAAHAYDRGRYRDAFDRAARVHAYDPRPDAALLGEAAEIQTFALDAGTEHVAFLPLLADGGADAPAYWTEAVSRALTEEFWAQPPLFVAPVPPHLVRRELGRMGRRAPFTRNEAVGIGRALEATLVFAPELRARTREETSRRETRRAIATRSGQDTVYTEVHATLRLRAEATFRLIETTTRNVVAEGRVPVEVDAPLHYATYAGDPATLKMPSAAVRDLFDAAEQRHAERDLDAALQHALADALAAAAFDAILRQVP